MYCSHCGVQVQPEHKFCPSCGRPLGPVPTPQASPRTRLQSHLQFVGILWIAYAGLKVLAGLAILFAGKVILARVHLPAEAGFVPSLVSGVGWLVLIAAAVGILAGWGLLQKEPWARLLSLVLAFLALFNIPFGTALGIYSLWVLLPQESAQEYDRMARA